jgi:glycosyltransferase involved in cell wall biosynthesis
MGYLISICIPTFNRANLLKNTLTSIFNQNANLDDFEIVISDNCSTDDTEQVVLEFAQKFTNIKYYKLPTEISGDNNIVNSLSSAKGQYLKLCNDTALFENGCINSLIEMIKVNNIEKPIIFLPNTDKKQIFNYGENFNTFININSFLTTSILAIGIWKEDYDKLNHIQDAFEYKLPALNLLRKNFEQKNNFLIFNKKIFSVQYVPNKGGYNIIEVFVTNYLGIVLRKEYKKNNLKLLVFEKEKLKVLLKFVAPWMKLLKKPNSGFTFSIKGANKKLFKVYYYNPLYYLMVIFFFFFDIIQKFKK